MGTADGGAELQDPTPVHAYAAAGEKAPAIVLLDDGSRTILCPRCDATSGLENNYCATCGFPFTMEGADRAAQATTDAFAVTSFIVGLISLPLCMCLSAVGGLGALLAAVLGWSSLNRITATGRTRRGRGLAIAGLVFAIIGLAIALARIAGLL